MIVTSEFNDFRTIAERCNQIHVFNGIQIAELDSLKTKTEFAKAMLFPKHFIKMAHLSFHKRYDRILTNGLFHDLDNAIFYEQNQAQIILFDEGYSTYAKSFWNALEEFSKGHIIVRRLSKLIFRRTYLDEVAKDIFLYDADLCVNKMPFRIHSIWDKNEADADKIFEMINYIFDTSKVKTEYAKKYIFFEECFASDFNNNGDLNLIMLIRDLVGKENLMIKLHPRDKTNRFAENGICTNKTISFPAEALAADIQNSNTVFITYSSGSVLNYKFISSCNIKSILLYKLMPTGFINMPEDRLRWFEAFGKKYSDQFFVPETMEELKSLLNYFEEIM